jgi:hypothetical protein
MEFTKTIGRKDICLPANTIEEALADTEEVVVDYIWETGYKQGDFM